MRKVSYVDVHHHYNPLRESSLNDGIKQKIMRGRTYSHDIVQTLEMMEACGIKKSILSYSDSLLSLSENECTLACTRINETYAELTAKYPNLGAFARIPVVSNRDLALKEIEYALDILHLDGILLPVSVFGVYPSSGPYLEVYKEMEKRKGTIFFHPFVSEEQIENNEEKRYVLIQDITRATFELALNRLPIRFPGIHFIMSYSGGNVPYLLKDNGPDQAHSSATHGKHPLPQGLKKHFEGIYYDTCSLARTGFIEKADVFPNKERILYGSNFPYSTIETARTEMEKLNLYRDDGQIYMDETCGEDSSFLL